MDTRYEPCNEYGRDHGAFVCVCVCIHVCVCVCDVTQVSNNYLSWRRWMDGDVDHTTGSNW